MAGLTRQLGYGSEVIVACCDVVVHDVRKVFTAANVELYGGGGTDIGNGLRWFTDRKSGPVDLLVVGAYPEGRDWDLRRGSPDERAEVLANIAAVPLPATDPLHGAAGSLMEAWSSPVAARVVE